MKPIPIARALTKEQLRVLNEWVKANNLDPESLEICWEFKYGFQIFAKSKDNQENWSIDFVDKGGENNETKNPD